MCCQSHSKMKFSYIFSVAMKPVGSPLVMTMPFSQRKVSEATFTGRQPLRSLPLNIGTNPSSSWAPANAAANKEKSRAESRVSFMRGGGMRCEAEEDNGKIKSERESRRFSSQAMTMEKSYSHP